MTQNFTFDYYGQRRAFEYLQAEFGTFIRRIYQRLGPKAKEMVGEGGAQTHVRRCLERADEHNLIVWNMTDPADVVLAARSRAYLQHNDGSGGYQHYLGTMGLEPPAPVEIQLGLLEG